MGALCPLVGCSVTMNQLELLLGGGPGAGGDGAAPMCGDPASAWERVYADPLLPVSRGHGQLGLNAGLSA